MPGISALQGPHQVAQRFMKTTLPLYLLIEVALRLKTSVRNEDTVARMGGDEFLVVLGELSTEPNAAAVQAGQDRREKNP